MVDRTTTRLFPTIRLARALALVAALMLATGTSARADVPSVEAPHPSASAIACITGMIGASVTVTLGVLAAPATGNTSLVPSKWLAWKMLGACLAAVASESAQEALTQ